MSTGKQIKKIVLTLLSDGQEHSMAEIREYVLSQNIILDKSSTLLRNIIHNLKKEYPNLLNPSRGIYQLHLEDNGPVDYYAELSHSIETIEQTLQECLNFNWYSCSNSELEIARTKVKMLFKLANTITTQLK